MSARISYERGRPDRPQRSVPYRREAVLPPRSTEQRVLLVGPSKSLEPIVSSEALLALRALRTAITLEITVAEESAAVGIVCPSDGRVAVERALRGATGEWQVIAAPPSAASHGLHLACPLGPSSRPTWAPVRDLASFAGADPLAAVLEAVQPLGGDEQFVFYLQIRPAAPPRWDDIGRALTRPARATSAGELIAHQFGGGPREPRFEPQTERALIDRLSQPAFDAQGMLVLSGPVPARLTNRARSLAAVFGSRFDCGFGGFSLDEWRHLSGIDEARHLLAGVAAHRLTAGELAALWHPVAGNVVIPGVAHIRRPETLVPPALERNDGLLLGVHRQRGREVPIRLPRSDLEAGHLAIIGRTGVGKTTFVHQVLGQAIGHPDRIGVGAIDPHGDLARDIAACSIPVGRQSDVVLLELGDTAYPVGLPFFDLPPGVRREVAVQNIFSTVRLIFREHWSPTRMEDAVFAATATLCSLPQTTLLDLPRLFGDATFRRHALAHLDEPVALAFWDNYAALSEASQRELVRPILYRLRAFYRSPAIRNIVCQRRGIDLAEVLDRGKVLLVSLSGAEIQAEADLLGELIIARLHLAALARLDRPRAERHPFYLAVDESQRFRGASLPILLSEGRKLGLPLILSTQFLDAWGESLAESVLGNVGALVAFRCSLSDSRRLHNSVRPFTPEQVEDLDRHEAIVKLQVGGATLPAFDIHTLPINRRPNDALFQAMREQTRTAYARPRHVVEEEIAGTHERPTHSFKGEDVDEE